MEPLRKPLQGVTNIIRFNWHFYVLAFIALAGILFYAPFLNPAYIPYVEIFTALATLSIILSLAVSWYVYDGSALYSLRWMDSIKIQEGTTIVNINAGFDETSALVQHKFPNATIIVFDFYDAAKHTEVSIKRARKAYPAFPGTTAITTTKIPLADASADRILLTLAAHEIRADEERTVFFKELQRILKPGGQVLVTEHLRDLPNFLAYNIGSFHFFSKATWLHTFTASGFNVLQEQKHTPFITTFILEKYAATS